MNNLSSLIEAMAFILEAGKSAPQGRMVVPFVYHAITEVFFSPAI